MCSSDLGQPPVDQHRRGDAAQEAAQLVEGLAGLGDGPVEDRLRGPRVPGGLPLGPGQVHAQAHEALLGPVVDVPLQAGAGVGLGAPAPGRR